MFEARKTRHKHSRNTQLFGQLPFGFIKLKWNFVKYFLVKYHATIDFCELDNADNSLYMDD